LIKTETVSAYFLSAHSSVEIAIACIELLLRGCSSRQNYHTTSRELILTDRGSSTTLDELRRT